MTLTKRTLKAFGCFLAALLLVLSLAGTAFADAYKRSCTATFNGEEITSTFAESGFGTAVAEMEPGDSVELTITTKNDYSTATDWYMTNEVLSTLEDNSVASGGAYTFSLTYDGDVIKSSSSVGGDTTSDKKGLYNATEGLEDFFFIGSLGPNKTGTVVLKISLDGNTMQNSYQDTLAKLQMNFAVGLPDAEIVGVPETSEPDVSDEPDEDALGNIIPKMGDVEWTTISSILSVVGVVMLALGFISLRSDRKRKEGN